MEGARGAKVGGGGGGVILVCGCGGGGLSRISRQNMKSEKCHVNQSRWTLSKGVNDSGVLGCL